MNDENKTPALGRGATECEWEMTRKSWKVAMRRSKSGLLSLCEELENWSAFGGKADIPFALQMSAYDPKRTSSFTLQKARGQ